MKPTSAVPRPAPRAPWLLLACTLILAGCGYLLLNTTAPPAHSPTGDRTAALPSPQDSPTTHRRSAPASAQSPRPSTASPPPSEVAALPPRGEGRAADSQIQHLLEQAWPSDLPAPQEQQLRRDGALLLRADATGVGRNRFPKMFGDRPAKAVAPAFSRFRIQAAIARKDESAGRAVVHLVWAGADRGGTYTDGRITDLVFTRTNGASPWTPQHQPRS